MEYKGLHKIERLILMEKVELHENMKIFQFYCLNYFFLGILFFLKLIDLSISLYAFSLSNDFVEYNFVSRNLLSNPSLLFLISNIIVFFGCVLNYFFRKKHDYLISLNIAIDFSIFILICVLINNFTELFQWGCYYGV